MAKVYVNRVWMTTATAGTGTIILGSARAGYLTFADGGVANADTVTYCIIDGNNFELGTGTYTSAGTLMSRDTVTKSLIAGVAGTTKLTLSGSAEVFLAHDADDTAFLDRANTFTQAQTITLTGGCNLVIDSYDTGSGGTNANVFLSMVNYNNDGYADGFSVKYARGTVGAPLAVQLDDVLCYAFSPFGHDGTNFVNSCAVTFAVDGTVSAGSVPTSMRFLTGTTGSVERMRIASDGNVAIGTTLTTGAKFRICDSDAGASAGPVYDLFRDSASPAASDLIGEVQFSGRDSAANVQEYANITAVITSPTSTAETGDLTISTVNAGAVAEKLRIASHGGLGIGGANYGTSGQVLSSGGSSAAPSWSDLIALQPVPLSKNILTANTTITAGYSAYIPYFAEIADTFTLEVGLASFLEIG